METEECQLMNLSERIQRRFKPFGGVELPDVKREINLIDSIPVFFERGLYAMTESMLRGLRRVVSKTSTHRGEFLQIQVFAYEDETGPAGIDAKSLADKRACELQKALQTLGYGGKFWIRWETCLPKNPREPTPAEISILGPGKHS